MGPSIVPKYLDVLSTCNQYKKNEEFLCTFNPVVYFSHTVLSGFKCSVNSHLAYLKAIIMALFASNLFIRKIIFLSGDLFYLVAFQGKCRREKKQPKPPIMTQ